MSKTIFITGSSSGIGKATAILFAKRGWNVAATMRNPEKKNELEGIPNIKVFPLDVTNRESIENAYYNSINAYGKIDVLLNNAGYGLAGPLESASEGKILDQFDTNMFGVIRTIQQFLPHFRDKRSGTIINVTSIGGLVGLPFNSIYHATKFGLDGLSESLNYELRPFGIKVKVVAPGGVYTDFASRSLKFTFDEGNQTPYDKEMAKVFHRFESNKSNYSTPEQIAEVIYNAATDGSEQIRYLAGEDAIRMYAASNQMSDEDFFAMVNQNFGLHE